MPRPQAFKNRTRKQTVPGLVADDLLRLWILRILVPMGAARHFLHHGCYQHEHLADFLDLPMDDDNDEGINTNRVMKQLRQMHQQAESVAMEWQVAAELRANSDRLAELMGLNTAERRLLEFTVILHSHRLLDDTADMLQGLSNHVLFEVLSTLLDIPLTEVKQALSGKGRLAAAGLLSVDSNPCCLRSKLDMLSNSFIEQMLTEIQDPAELLRGMLSPSPKPTLSLDDYPHLQRSLEILLPFLRESAATARKGVNIFMYGPPGTGKSELARLLALINGQQLFEVACEDEEGDPVVGEKRLRSYRAAQNFLARRPTFLLFDEVEDVFNDGSELWGRKSTAQARKAWMNRMLEENPVPAIWLSNTAHGLDRAFLRRFDMVLELPVPPKPQRERIVRAQCEGLVDEAAVNTLAEAEGLTPAVITRAAGVLKLVRDHLPAERLPSAMTHLVGNTLQAQGWGPLRDRAAEARPGFYDPRFVNTTTDLDRLAGRLERHPRGSLCFHGPSGTGKTAFGRWLAERLQRPLLVRRASDLLDMYVGQTERRIADAFREAAETGSVLLIDEVDSFLQDRRRASRSWEVSQVNEMLTQMESFPGLFIASTNLMEGLDPATLRRFDVKLRFDYLRPDQARELLVCQCRDLGLPDPAESDLERVARLKALTPGDFAVARRQARMCGVSDAGELTRVLEEECGMKEDGRKQAMGFV